MTLRQVRVVNNQVYFCCGGGVANLGGDLTVTRSYFAGNSSASCCGGAVFSDGGARTKISNSTFSKNRTGDCCGGAVYNRSARTVITDSTFSENSAVSQKGGTIFNEEGVITIAGSVIKNSSLEAREMGDGNYGGAIHSEYGTLRLTDSLIANSHTPGGNGGAISSDSGLLVVKGSTIRGNSALDFGGGIYADGDHTILKDSRVIGNKTRDGCCGGGLWIWGTGRISNTLVRGNDQVGSHDPGGGGLHVFAETPGTPFVITNSTFAENTSGRYGGGILVEGPGGLRMTNSTISGNESGAIGGGIYEAGAGPVRLLHSTIAFNEAAGPGGGIGTDGLDFFVEGLIVSNNSMDCNGPLGNARGVNLDSDSNCFDDDRALHGGARLGPLGDYGGKTPTHALKPASNAIDAAPGSGCPPPKRDQRGIKRPQNGDGKGRARCDLGSFERKP